MSSKTTLTYGQQWSYRLAEKQNSTDTCPHVNQYVLIIKRAEYARHYQPRYHTDVKMIINATMIQN